MPPVRDASTKPSAATVLPAPVACSNQKRRAAPGSSATASDGRLLLRLLGRIPVERLLVGQLVALELDLAGVQLLGARRRCRARRCGDLQLRRERDQRARQGVDLVGGERRAVRQVRLVLRQQPLEARASASSCAATRSRARSRPASISASAASRALRRAVPSRQRDARLLAVEHEGLSREFLGARQVVAGNRRGIGHGACVSHGWQFL